ncbi:Pentatricopeptide repeat-containing protein, mitochondrial [Sarracenia purpurea var. burkii]
MMCRSITVIRHGMKATPPCLKWIIRFRPSSSFNIGTPLRNPQQWLRSPPYSLVATATTESSNVLNAIDHSMASHFPPSLIIEDFTRFCYQRDLPKAMKAIDSMQKHKLWADSITYSELLKCCLDRGAIHHVRLVHEHLFSRGHHPNTFVINILLNVYVKFNLLSEARALFDQMPERNVVSWTTMIAAYTNAMLHDKALGFLTLMIRDGVRPNMFTYSTVLRACHRLPTLRQLHSNIMKTGLDSDVFVRSALIDIYSKWGELHNALRVFDEMITGDLVVWNSIIGGFAQNTDGDEALNLFKRMKHAGFLADQGTLTSVLRACTGLALLELGRQIHVHNMTLSISEPLTIKSAMGKFGQIWSLSSPLHNCVSLQSSKQINTKETKRQTTL